MNVTQLRTNIIELVQTLQGMQEINDLAVGDYILEKYNISCNYYVFQDELKKKEEIGLGLHQMMLIRSSERLRSVLETLTFIHFR
jgi:acetyl-CoA carboxylase beta subunit